MVFTLFLTPERIIQSRNAESVVQPENHIGLKGTCTTRFFPKAKKMNMWHNVASYNTYTTKTQWRQEWGGQGPITPRPPNIEFAGERPLKINPI